MFHVCAICISICLAIPLLIMLYVAHLLVLVCLPIVCLYLFPVPPPGVCLYVCQGAYFYRIIDSFIDQTGVNTDSPLGGYFRDDPGGLAINHTHMVSAE